MASVPFHEALSTLENMFPELDSNVIKTVLDARDGHMESTVEALLRMSRAKRGAGDGGMSGIPSGNNRSYGGGSGGGDHHSGGGGYDRDDDRRNYDEAPRTNDMGSRGGGYGGAYNDPYSNVPPPRDDGSIWGWLTGDEPEEPPQRGGYGPGGGRQQQPEEDDTFSWVANSASFYAGEFSRNVKSMTDAIAEELLGPAEDEEGEEIIPEDEENRGEGRVVAGGAAVSASRRTKKDDKDNAPKTAPKKKKTEEEEEEDTLGGFLNMLGLDDDEEEEGKAPRRDCKKDK